MLSSPLFTSSGQSDMRLHCLLFSENLEKDIMSRGKKFIVRAEIGTLHAFKSRDNEMSDAIL